MITDIPFSKSEDELLVRELILSIQSSTESEQGAAMKKIFDTCISEQNKIAITQPSIGLIPVLLNILDTYDVGSLSVAWSVAIFGRLSASPRNELTLGSQEVGIVKHFQRLITRNNLKDNIFTFFGNIILNRKLHSYLLSDELGLLEASFLEISRNPEYTKVYTFLANAVSTMEDYYCSEIIKFNFHKKIYDRLIYGGIQCNLWVDRGTGVLYRSILFLTCLSSLPSSRQALRNLELKSFLISLLETNFKEKLYAAIILVNLYGNEEDFFLGNSQNNKITNNNKYQNMNHRKEQSLLEQYPEVYDLFLTFVIATMYFDCDPSSSLSTNQLIRNNANNNNNNKEKQTKWSRLSKKRERMIYHEVNEFKRSGFAYGVLRLRDLTATFLSLSKHPAHKRIMLSNEKTLFILHEILHSFVENESEYQAIYQNFVSNAGGGGQDYDTVENVLETLLQLTFVTNENRDHLFISMKKEGGREEEDDDNDNDYDDDDDYTSLLKSFQKREFQFISKCKFLLKHLQEDRIEKFSSSARCYTQVLYSRLITSISSIRPSTSYSSFPSSTTSPPQANKLSEQITLPAPPQQQQRQLSAEQQLNPEEKLNNSTQLLPPPTSATLAPPPSSAVVTAIVGELLQHLTISSSSVPSSPPRSPSKLKTEIDYAGAWDCLKDIRKQSSPKDIEQLLEDYGIYQIEDLKYLKKSEIDSFLPFLKIIQQRKFPVFMGYSSPPNTDEINQNIEEDEKEESNFRDDEKK